ncbi:hypothetical protein BDZ89DRAFT_1134734 [Hymenopellis radicata]|nr:hypothetical protein BDZ89DRAFT_1134734 [Hymenopellis radicata]
MLNKVGVTIEQAAADRTMGGHVQKARIQSHDALADALETSYKRLKENFEKEHDLDQEIKALPSHLQLLFCLANAPESSTSTYASSYLFNLNAPPPAVEVLTWKKILEDDPFEGEHWEGVYGMPPGSIKNQREPDSDSDASSLWSLHSDERSSDSLPTPPRSPSPTSSPAFTPSLPDIRLSVLHRKEVEDLQARQYWRSDWRMPVQGMSTRFDIGNASTLGPTLQNVMGRNRAVPTEFVHLADKYIYEHDAVREVLIALQGRSNVMLNDAYKATPRLLHLSLASQASILASLGERCTCLKHLRNFVTRVFSTPSKTRTLEAFADAVDAELRLLDTWCAEKEEQIVLATNGALPGQSLVCLWARPFTEGIAVDDYGCFVGSALRCDTGEPGAGERITAGVVMRVFIRSSEPLWSMVGQWLKDGMGIGDINDLDDEFFIESNGLGSGAFGVGLLDPDYWTEGYTLRYEDEEDGRRKGLPTFFRPVAEPVLASGKAVGLLKALGVGVSGIEWRWRSLAELVAGGADQDEASGLFSVSIDTLSSLIHDELAPYCQSTGLALSKAVVGECDLWRRLSTIQDLYLMRKGDAMSHFCDVLFAKMDSQQHWSDFHFLNTTFTDVVESSVNIGAGEWVQLSLVRLSYRGSKDKSVGRTVRGLEGLLVEYAVPFPLIYIFTPKILHIYGELFTFLLQIKRAKVVLERILSTHALLDFLTTYVIHVQVFKFHEALQKATSLDQMMQVHEEHLQRLQSLCLLQSDTAALHRSILSILDMALQFSNMFVAFAGDTTTHDISTSMLTKRRRTKTQRRMRRNVVGFSAVVDDDSEDSSDSDEEMEEPQTSFSVAHDVIEEAGDDVGRLDRMSSELDALVKFVRRGAESLAGGSGEAATTFGVIAFTLEDWDA